MADFFEFLFSLFSSDTGGGGGGTQSGSSRPDGEVLD